MAKQQSYLGVDLGGGGVKLVELANDKNRARLLTYGYTNQSPLGENWLSDKQKTADLLAKVYKKAKAQTRDALAALPIHLVFNSVLNLQKQEEKELQAAALSGVAKLTGKDPAKIVVDYKIIKEIKEGERAGYLKVLVTAADKTLISDFTETFTLAGLNLTSLEVEPFAWVRALVGRDTATVLLVDIGSRRTNVLVVENSFPVFSRSVALGGDLLTEAITKSAGISRDQAEVLKKDATAMSKLGGVAGFPKIFQDALNPLTTEIRYFLDNYFASNDGVKQIDRMVLAGGTSQLFGLSEFLGKTFNLRVFVGDPWARVLYNNELRPVLDELGPRFVTSIGLAMKDIEK